MGGVAGLIWGIGAQPHACSFLPVQTASQSNKSEHRDVSLRELNGKLVTITGTNSARTLSACGCHNVPLCGRANRLRVLIRSYIECLLKKEFSFFRDKP